MTTSTPAVPYHSTDYGGRGPHWALVHRGGECGGHQVPTSFPFFPSQRVRVKRLRLSASPIAWSRCSRQAFHVSFSVPATLALFILHHHLRDARINPSCLPTRHKARVGLKHDHTVLSRARHLPWVSEASGPANAGNALDEQRFTPPRNASRYGRARAEHGAGELH